jgi:mono/diheme cytochrome c family protein
MHSRQWILLAALSAVLALSRCGNGQEASGKSAVAQEPSEASIKRAYTMKCSLCHGSDGKLMASKAPDLSTSTMDLESRVALITYGKGTMPPQKDILDTPTIRGIARYIETFRETK